ncbi:bile acid:sodium symporter family protein [Nocardia sp. CA-119907]|uniref:bile acid:sodium symporter family protein n=1 Tax=Nocardia sp. CA-119907 TaxID=3239973 RepID=UPI003D95AB8A
MDLVSTALPVGMGMVMLGLGLGLTVGDFARIAHRPRAVLAALLTQLLVLPAVCVGLIYLFGLSPILAVGMMLLAASPGGPIANLYSHLFGGDVALNVSLTAINSVLAIVTMPVIYNFAVLHYAAGDGALGLQFGKAVEVFAIVLVPVAIGMFIRQRRATIARRLDRPVRITSLALVVVLIVAALVQNWEILADNFGHLAGATATFGAVNLALGYSLPRLVSVVHAQAVACSFEIGLHNAVMAIVIARTVIGSEQMALPPAVYTVIQLPLALVFGLVLMKMAATPHATPRAVERPTPIGERP